MDGRKVRILDIIDVHTCECLAANPRRCWRNNDVIEVLEELMLLHGTLEYLRSDNGSEFMAKKIWHVGECRCNHSVEPSNHSENGYCESFDARMRDEFFKWRVVWEYA